MSKIRIVPDKDYEVLKKYLASPESRIVLIPEKIAKETNTKNIDENVLDYDHGGEADLEIDLVYHENHYFFDYLKEEGE